MLWAAATPWFIAAGEITAANNSTNPSNMQIHIKVSKTDPFRKQVDISMECTNNDLCQISAISLLVFVKSDEGGIGCHFTFPMECFVSKAREVLTTAQNWTAVVKISRLATLSNNQDFVVLITYSSS